MMMHRPWKLLGIKFRAWISFCLSSNQVIISRILRILLFRPTMREKDKMTDRQGQDKILILFRVALNKIMRKMSTKSWVRHGDPRSKGEIILRREVIQMILEFFLISFRLPRSRLIRLIALISPQNSSSHNQQVKRNIPHFFLRNSDKWIRKLKIYQED